MQQPDAIWKQHPLRLTIIAAMTLLAFAGLDGGAPRSYVAKRDMEVAADGAAYTKANAAAAGQNPEQLDRAAKAVAARCDVTTEPNVDGPFARYGRAADGRTIEAVVPLPRKLLLISLLASRSSATGTFGLLAAQP